MAGLGKKAQSSLEYLLVLALTLGILVPTTYLFYNYSKQSGNDIKDSQITRLGKSIIDSAETVFYSGINSKTVLELNVPDNVISAVIIDGRELVFNMTSSLNLTEIVFFSNVNLTTDKKDCNYNICKIAGLGSVGLKKVKIEAVAKDTVNITVLSS